MAVRTTGTGLGALLLAVLLMASSLAAASDGAPRAWKKAWPRTDFSRHSVPLDEIAGGGPPKDGIPAIDNPEFAPVAKVRGLADTEPVISVRINGDARAYPLRVLIWHEIANDVVGGVPVAVTYCPLCDAGIVFDRRVDGQVLDFGTTGKLRHSDLVMYDRQTESWWQQFVGRAIVGDLTGAELRMIPARIESVALYRAREADGLILLPPGRDRPYGQNPYAGYDRQRRPLRAFFKGDLPKGIAPMARVVRVGRQAWPLQRLRAARRIEYADLVLTWEPGQNSALDDRRITRGRDIGNVLVQRRTDRGLVDVVYDVTFAFAFHAFYPDGTLHSR